MRGRIAGMAIGAMLAAAPVQVSGAAAPAQPMASAGHVRIIHGIETSPAFRAAVEALDRGHDQWIANIIALTEVPAPAFKEDARARLYADMFRKLGLAEVTIDEAGNVLGLRKGVNRGGKVVVVSRSPRHRLPEGTPTKVRREGDKLFAPGVGDDATGLATQISLINALNEAAIETPSDILFVGTVGEEGLGNLRGVRYLFTEGEYKGRIGAFFFLARRLLAGRIHHRRPRIAALSRHLHRAWRAQLRRVRAGEPGGGALSSAVIELTRSPLRPLPRTTYSASVIGGGTSVNSIPHEAWMDVDMRPKALPNWPRWKPASSRR